MAKPDPALFESHQDLCPTDTIQGRHFSVIGCGSLGTIMARILARLGAHKFHLVDGEDVRLHHLNREVFTHDQIGRNKAAALGDQLAGIHPKVRSITTAKPFDADTLKADREDIVVCATSDVNLPAVVLEAMKVLECERPPALFVTRHTGLVGGYWMADLAQEPDARIPDDLPWLVPTGRDESDAQSRIATTAHTVAGLTAQAIVQHLTGRPLRRMATIDLGALLDP